MRCTTLLLLITAGTASLLPTLAAAHAEHDKPRYVAEHGEDKGRCDKISEPCKTIGYAAQQASKGDNILVAAGNYAIDDVNELFYLISNVVPVKGGYSARQFKRDTNSNPTRLVGVPHEYADELAEKGFTVIVDRKGMDTASTDQLTEKMAALEEMRSGQTNVPCSGGGAGQFPCHNIDLVAHVPLSAMGNSTQGNDVWGHFDLNDGREYALMGLGNGVAVVDLSTPDAPRVVSHIPGENTTWRDIKVLQTYSPAGKLWQSYAYVTADNASVGLQIIDLNELPERATLVNADKTDISAHNIYLSNVDYSTGVALTGLQPILHMAGSNNKGGAFNSYALTNPAAPTPLYRHASDSRSNYSHDVASMAIFDARKDSQCANATDHCEILFDFNENDVRLWDKTNNQTPVELSRTSYPQASYVHSGWRSEDQLVMMVHDELDEQTYGLNTTLRFFDISDLTRPVLLSTYTGPTRAIDHNGFVRGNRYYMSNYERGLTVLDISDPALPTEVGFFDTYPVSNLPAFNGAWGTYPFLPSGLVLISDINSGLYVVRDNSLAVSQGSLAFTARDYRANEDSELTIEVIRTGGNTGAVSVGYETHTGSASRDDFTMTSGRLDWADGEGGSKSFSVAITADELMDEVHELLFVRLFDPQGGATLASPNLALAYINGLPNKGLVSFMDTEVSVSNTATTATISLMRAGGREESVSVSLVTDDAAKAAFKLEPETVTWAANESGVKTVLLTPLKPTASGGSRSFVVSLAGDNLGAAASTQLTVTLGNNQPAQSPGNKKSGGNAGLPLTLSLVLLLGLRISRSRRSGGNSRP